MRTFSYVVATLGCAACALPLFGQTAPAAESKSIIFYEDFESDLSRWEKDGRSDSCCEHSVNLVDTVARWGKQSARFEHRLNDPQVNLGARAEISNPPLKLQPDGEYWIGFSTYLPPEFAFESTWQLVFQLHGVPDFDLNESWRNPPVALFIDGDRWEVKLRGNADPVNRNDRDVEGVHKFSYRLAKAETGTWTDWVFHLKLSPGRDGFARVYQNRKRVVDHAGPTGYNDKKGPYLKLGIYRSKACKSAKQVLYHDELWVGNAAADLHAVLPGRKPR